MPWTQGAAPAWRRTRPFGVTCCVLEGGAQSRRANVESLSPDDTGDVSLDRLNAEDMYESGERKGAA